MTIPIDDKHKISKNFSEEKSDMLGFKQFVAEDRRREGELLRDIQDLRRQTQLLRQKMMIQKEMGKIRETKLQ